MKASGLSWPGGAWCSRTPSREGLRGHWARALALLPALGAVRLHPDGPRDVSGWRGDRHSEGGGPPGQGGESRLVSNRCPRAARKVALKNRQAGGFEVVGRLKIRLLTSGAMVVKLETLPRPLRSASAPQMRASPKLGSYRLPQLRASRFLVCEDACKGRAKGCETPLRTRPGAERLQVSSRKSWAGPWAKTRSICACV